MSTKESQDDYLGKSNVNLEEPARTIKCYLPKIAPNTGNRREMIAKYRNHVLMHEGEL